MSVMFSKGRCPHIFVCINDYVGEFLPEIQTDADFFLLETIPASEGITLTVMLLCSFKCQLVMFSKGRCPHIFVCINDYVGEF